MFTFLAEVFEEFLAVDELPALGLGYPAIDFLADSSAEMGLVPVALHEGVESLGDDGLSVFELPRLHSFVNQLFEFGTERNIHQAADPSLAVGALNLKGECHSFRGGFDILRDRLSGLSGALKKAANRISRHLAGLVERPPESTDFRYGGNDNVVASLRGSLEYDSVTVLRQRSAPEIMLAISGGVARKRIPRGSPKNNRNQTPQADAF